ncbi:MAG TPA: hypothetical protein VKG01_05000 [Thermoanaerobaculia bacterium]|nr:hypothetical protein [Thermoanaerobaculia bacterium]
MGILDELTNLAGQFASGKVSDNQVHETYDRAARAVPQQDLAGGLTEAFRSDQTPPFQEMVTGLFNQSSPDQKAALLNQLLQTFGPGLQQALASGGLGSLAGMVSGGTVTPQQATQVAPEQVEVLAQKAAKKDPSVMERAAGFYAQHPTLVKAIGTASLAFLVSRLSQRRQ